MRVPATLARPGAALRRCAMVARLTLGILCLVSGSAVGQDRPSEPGPDTVALVLMSTARTLEAGTFLSAQDRIALGPHERITLVLADGKTRSLNGRFEGTPEDVGAATRGHADFFGKLQRMLDRRDQIGARVGAVRALNACRETPANPLDLPVRSTGIVCVPAEGPVHFRRYQAAWEATLTVISVNTREAAAVPFPSGVCVADWPQDLPLEPDEAYFLRFSADPFRRSAILPRAVGIAPEESPIPAMVRLGCEMQVQAWLGATLSAAVVEQDDMPATK